MGCFLLVLSVLAALADGQIIFGGTGGSSSSASSPGRGSSSPGRGSISPGRGSISPGGGSFSPGGGSFSPGGGSFSPSRGTISPARATGSQDRSCTSPEGRPGVCGLPDGCATIRRRIQLKDAAYIRRAFCGRQDGKILLCCSDTTQSSSVSPVSSSPVSSSPVGPARFQPPPSRPSQPSVSIPAAPSPSCPRFRSPSRCGLSSFSPSRVVNGLPVRSLGDFPWMAALRYSSEPRYKCGGAIISDRWIITAAHCLLNDGPTEVVVGDLNLVTDTDDSGSHPPQVIPVQLTSRHPNYRREIRGNDKGLFDDIALIKLARRIQFSEVVGPICIDSSPRSVAELEGSRAYVAGWGATEFGGLESPAMRWGRVDISRQRQCQLSYARRGNRVDEKQLCASGKSDQGSVDTCHGDSGGPLMIRRTWNNLQRWHIAGIVSYGTGCGNPGTPGVYTHVGAHLDWIGCTINSN